MIAACCRGLASVGTLACIGIERSLAAPPPQRERFLAILAPQRRSTSDQEAENHGSVIVGQLDQPGLCDQSAQFDQLPRSLTPRHLPRPRVMPGSPGEQPVVHRLHSPRCR